MSAVASEWSKLFGKRFELTLQYSSECKDQQESGDDRTFRTHFLDQFLRRKEELKDELNFTKSELNDFDIQIWRTHTNFMNLCGHLTRYCKKHLNAELCTQAWLKFCTILNTFDLVERDLAKKEGTLTSVHLCEAPGAFVTCLNHHIAIRYPGLSLNWKATTFNPYYEGNSIQEMINDDRFIKNTLPNWIFGDDLTGNIMSLKNLQSLKEVCRENVQIDLVTADGSIDCSEKPDMQESLVAQLLYWEFVTALNIISPRGNFIMKAFTVLEEFTISMVYLLCTAFEQVHFCKPGPSKPGNSEVYIVCIGFRGLDVLGTNFYEVIMQRTNSSDFTSSLFPLEDIPDCFLSKLLECEEYFIRHQIQAIHSNISSFQHLPGKRKKFINGQKDLICKMFVKNFDLRPLGSNQTVTYVKGASPDKIPSSYCKEHSHNFTSGNFYERLQQKRSTWLERANLDGSNEDVGAHSYTYHLFSGSFQEITESEIIDWRPILGKKFSTVASTQFASNYLIKDLFEARQLSLTSNVIFGEDHETLNREMFFRDAAVVKELEELLHLSTYSAPCALNINYEDSCKVTIDTVELAQLRQSECVSVTSLSRNTTPTSKSSDKSSQLVKTVTEMIGIANNSNDKTIDLLFSSAYESNEVLGGETSKDALCSVLALGLGLLKEGGMLICQIGDIFTNYNAGIVYICTRQFSRIGILKPKSWRASRLLICQGLNKPNSSLIEYLKKLLVLRGDILDGKLQENDVIHTLPISCTLESEFLDFMKQTNESFSKLQLNSVKHAQMMNKTCL